MSIYGFSYAQGRNPQAAVVLFGFVPQGSGVSAAAPARPLARPPIRRFDPWYEHELAPVLLMFEDD